jgi:hypothetical protein
MRKLLLIIAVAVAGYLAGPQVRNHVMPFLGSFRGFTMRLDPNEQDVIEDRRGQHGGRGGTSGDLPADAGGGDIGRIGPGPRGGPGGGMDGPWGDARGEAGPGGGFPGGGRGRGGGGIRCRDSQTGRDVDMSFCDRQDREQGRRR